MAQIHKKFTENQVKDLLQRYLQNRIERKYIEMILGIKKSRFFVLLKQYRANPEGFSIQYTRKKKPDLSIPILRETLSKS